jgi:hypothetical protein
VLKAARVSLEYAMAFHDREYQVYVMLGRPNAPPPWLELIWTRLFHALDPIIGAARGAAAVRSVQLWSEAGLAQPERNFVRPHRLERPGLAKMGT